MKKLFFVLTTLALAPGVAIAGEMPGYTPPKLSMTHYCMIGNQPELEPTVMKFKKI